MSDRKSSGWIKWPIILVVLAGAGYAGWLWYGQQAKNAAAIEYKTAAVLRGDLIQSVTANGQLTPVKSVAVGSQVSGIIVDIKADYNSKVTNGQVLAQIDPSTYQQYLTQAEADLANVAAALELATLDYRRASNLFAQKMIADADYDKALVGLHQAEAMVKIRESSVAKAKVDLERTTIYSPIDGIVISRVVDVGQTVAASLNAPTLFNLANDLHNLRIEAMVSEADVGGVVEGQRVNFTVDAFLNRTFNGEVTQVRYAPITNQNVVNYTTIVNVNNEDLKLRPGMTATASIITSQRTNALRVPNAALRFKPPEKAIVRGATNTAPKAVTGAAGSSANGSPGAGGDSAERRKRWEGMSPEEREKMRAQRGTGGSGGGRRSSESTVKTVYLLEKEMVNGVEQTVLNAVQVKVGISDGTNTEILDGLKEGDVVVTVANQTNAATAMRPAGSPMGGSPFGGGFRPR
jgi:HlyD family secretion protein